MYPLELKTCFSTLAKGHESSLFVSSEKPCENFNYFKEVLLKTEKTAATLPCVNEQGFGDFWQKFKERIKHLPRVFGKVGNVLVKNTVQSVASAGAKSVVNDNDDAWDLETLGTNIMVNSVAEVGANWIGGNYYNSDQGVGDKVVQLGLHGALGYASGEILYGEGEAGSASAIIGEMFGSGMRDVGVGKGAGVGMSQVLGGVIGAVISGNGDGVNAGSDAAGNAVENNSTYAEEYAKYLMEEEMEEEMLATEKAVKQIGEDTYNEIVDGVEDVAEFGAKLGIDLT